MPNFFVKTSLILHEPFSLDEKDTRHLFKVLRAETNEHISVSDENGNTYNCIKASNDMLVPIELINEAYAPKIKITLYQAILKGDSMDTAITKAVEAGAFEITPTITERTVAIPKSNANKIERYNRITEAAAKQSGRQAIPTVNEIINLTDFAPMGYDNILVASTAHKNNTVKQDYAELKHGKTALLIGPEGGFTENEINYLSKIGAKQISLGRNILRAETAGMAAILLILYENGEL
jgi:16S rRNA (uracil1498-N3)-methyltransferase